MENGGSGKTTLLRAIINELPENISITANEETAELFCNNKNIVQREVIMERNNNHNITLDKLTREALVMSNDVIIIGEIKGAESMSFLDSISTGHIGFATIHAYDAESAIDRLVTLMKKDPIAIQYTDKYLSDLLAKSIDIVIFMRNFKIQEIAEIGYIKATEKICINKLYEYKYYANSQDNNSNKLKFTMLNKVKYNAKAKLDRYKLERKI